MSKVKNSNLSNAKKAKNDEFYTQYHDIEKEMNAYLDFDENVFRGKTILLPCDDPEWSNLPCISPKISHDLV
nr:adenine-specific methyltransferase EcoRI family protein [Alysiella crassa]